MVITELSLEEKLLEDVRQGNDVLLERGLFILSGLDSEEQIHEYTGRLGQLQRRFQEYFSESEGQNDLSKAKSLFDYLWQKPERFNSNFLLTDVIDAQLSEVDKKVGDCVGLTFLYTMLGLREGLNLSILRRPNHIKNRLTVENRTYDIENTSYNGFNSSDGKNYRELPAIILLSSVLNRRGMAKKYSGDPKGAIEDYDKATEIDPEYSGAYNNRGNAKQYSGDFEGAIKDYDKAIEIYPEYSRAYNNRGVAKYELGDLKGAIEDYDKAIEIDPEFSKARRNLRITESKLK